MTPPGHPAHRADAGTAAGTAAGVPPWVPTRPPAETGRGTREDARRDRRTHPSPRPPPSRPPPRPAPSPASPPLSPTCTVARITHPVRRSGPVRWLPADHPVRLRRRRRKGRKPGATPARSRHCEPGPVAG
ncbi:hypothetical protein SSCG_04317 [Streptomyces clavuligerus]|nr:hypothetical protein SSCG_04317 [Streptomyces clavuligerus]